MREILLLLGVGVLGFGVWWVVGVGGVVGGGLSGVCGWRLCLGLGRGLLYSALFVLIFAAALFALTFEKKQAAPAKAAQ